MEPNLQGVFNQPGWEFSFRNDALIISCPTWCEAVDLVRIGAETLRDWASKFGLPILLKATDNAKPIKITPKINAMATTPSTPNQKVFTAPEIFIWSDALADLLKRMRESDRAIFLIRNADDRQVWVNDQAAEIMRSSGEECVIRRVSDYWKPEDLHALYQRLRLDGGMPFEHTYQAKLNDQGVWGKLTARYEIVKVDGVSYRISTNLACEVLESVGTI